jgi:hypothetical protein
MNPSERWPRGLSLAGYVAMVAGAIDPMEGSVLILLGGGLVALSTFLSQDDRPLLTYRLWTFILLAIGIGALWGLSSVGGIGGPTGHSNWWGLLFLPYLAGWWMGLWGPGSPRWMPWLGIGVGLWYLAILVMVLRGLGQIHKAESNAPGIIIGAIGLLTIGGCILRLRKRTHR